MSESLLASRTRSWRRIGCAITAIAIGAGVVGVIAATPDWRAEASGHPSVSPVHKPVVARSICDSDVPRRSVIQIVERSRGDRPGVKVTFRVKGVKPRSLWDYEVSVASTTGSAAVRSSAVPRSAPTRTDSGPYRS